MQALLDRVGRGFDQGCLEFVEPGGRCWHLGRGGPLARLHLRDRATLMRILLNPELRLGEAYMDGAWQPDPLGPPPHLLPVFEIGQHLAAHRAAHGSLRGLRQRAAEFSERNTPRRARRNVAHHYDLDNAFYASFLDRGLFYSCAYFERPGQTLEDAQLAKCRLIARKLDLPRGARVLDIGCGWGGLALHLAREHGARVVGVTLSTAQLEVAQQRAHAEGLHRQVEFRLQDYRQVTECFDAVVSVGMFEHVGRPQYATFFRAVHDRLNPDGVALLHTIGRRSPPGRTNPWITRYIFPGGYVPAASEVLVPIERQQLTLADLEVWRLHYAETLAEWNRRFQAQRPAHAARFGERFCRMWEFYLQASESGFRYDDLVVFHFQLLRDRRRLPLTRDYLYRAQTVNSPARLVRTQR